MAPSVDIAPLLQLPRRELARILDGELCRRSLPDFVRGAWHIHHPSVPLSWGWHIDAICEHLQAVSEGEILRLIINCPPGLAKSLLVSVYWPAWMWTRAPETQILATAAAGDVVLRDARRHREICVSGWYQRLFRPEWRFLKAQDAKGYFATDAGGYRISRTTGQAMTGLRGDVLIMDDPIDASEAYGDKTKLEEIAQWRDTVFSTRKNRVDSREVLIMQRLHEMDMTGHLLGKTADEWTHLILPAEYDHRLVCRTPLEWRDPRTEDGQPLAPELLPSERLAAIRQDIGEAAYSAQYQQQPVPAAGTIFERAWFRYWTPRARPTWEWTVASCDFNRNRRQRGHTRDTDYAVIQVWGVHGRDRYLLREIRQKMGLAASIEAVRELRQHHSDLLRILIERSANGPSVIQAVQAEIEGVEGISVQGESKIQRASACTAAVEMGHVYLPDPQEYPWVEYWLAEVTGFPGRRRDDRVDAFTMAMIWIEKYQQHDSAFSFSLSA